ncbi:MAG TPA: hypothetical protein VGG39_14135 [Polyangiaceae bacterium]|jgi:hypothetical protein
MDSSDPQLIPPPPSSRRTPATEASFYRDLFSDLSLHTEWLEQVITGLPESGATEQLKGWAKALKDLHHAIDQVQAHLYDKRFARLFALDAPLAAFLSRLYAWCEEIADDFETLAVKLRRGEPVLAVFSHKAVNQSFAHFQKLSESLRESLSESRPMNADTRSAWQTFDADFEELLWATEWLHMSLAAKPGS